MKPDEGSSFAHRGNQINSLNITWAAASTYLYALRFPSGILPEQLDRGEIRSVYSMIGAPFLQARLASLLGYQECAITAGLDVRSWR